MYSTMASSSFNVVSTVSLFMITRARRLPAKTSVSSSRWRGELMDNFSYDNFKMMLQRACETHRFVWFPEFDPTSEIPQVLMRHDIDLSLERAVALAEIEAAHNVRATYFIRLNSTFYSPLSQRGYPCVQRLINLGHDLGLHFDPSFYVSDGISVLDGIEREKLILKYLVRHSSSGHLSAPTL